MYRIGFFVLLVLNIVLIILFVSGPKPPLHEKGIKDEISRELSFTEEQKARFDEMAINHREKVSDIERRERTLIKSFFDQLTLESSDNHREKLLHELQDLNREKIMVTYTHFEELKEICTEEQLSKFDKVIFRVVPILTNSTGGPHEKKGRPN